MRGNPLPFYSYLLLSHFVSVGESFCKGREMVSFTNAWRDAVANSFGPCSITCSRNREGRRVEEREGQIKSWVEGHVESQVKSQGAICFNTFRSIGHTPGGTRAHVAAGACLRQRGRCAPLRFCSYPDFPPRQLFPDSRKPPS